MLITATLLPQRLRQQAAGTNLLPGQQLWANGVSSFLFGTNDTIRWSTLNAGNDPAIPQALNTAHFQLLRTWFFANQNGSDFANRMQVVAQSGATPLCVLPDYANAAYNTQVVTALGSKCNIYEFGNEPDSNMSAYIQAWNTQIPQLKKINPNAKFIGPVVANHNNVQVFLSGVKQSGVLPDAISFHRYSCSSGMTAASCLSSVPSDLTNVITLVRGWVNSSLGPNIPLGITEWNYDAANPPGAYGQNAQFIDQYTKAVISAMIQAHLDFSNQFDLANGAGMGGLDMFDVLHNNGQPKQQYTTMKNLIAQYMTGTTNPSTTQTQTPPPTISSGVPSHVCLGSCPTGNPTQSPSTQPSTALLTPSGSQQPSTSLSPQPSGNNQLPTPQPKQSKHHTNVNGIIRQLINLLLQLLQLIIGMFRSLLKKQ